MNDMNKISAILLAAGESRRMAPVNKMTLPVDGTPLLRRTAQMLLHTRLHEIVVVVGHEAQTARKILKGLPIKIVENLNYTEGQMSSVHCGLSALSQPCKGVMIALSDQPLLEPGDINHLIKAFLNNDSISVLVPTYQGQRGNPIILSTTHRNKILKEGRNLGCKHLIDKNPDWVTTIEMEHDRVVFDLDTAEDVAALRFRLKGHTAEKHETNPIEVS